MKFTLVLSLFLVADAFARTQSPTLLVCTQNSSTVHCDPARASSCRSPADASREIVRENIDLISDGEREEGRAVSSKDITIEGARFKLFADGAFSRNADGTAYLPRVTVRLTAEDSPWTSESAAMATTASLAVFRLEASAARGTIDCRLE